MDQEMVYTLPEAATYTSKGKSTLRRLAKQGTLPSTKSEGGRLLFRRGDLDHLLATQYPEGMSHRDIADKYGLTRTLVIYHFQRLKVKPRAVSRGRRHATLYDEKTVVKFARLLGWDKPVQPGQPSENPTNGSLDHIPAVSSAD